MKVIIKKKGKRILAFMLALIMVLGVIPISSMNNAEAAGEAKLNETLLLSDNFSSDKWIEHVASPVGWWRLGNSSANLAGVLDTVNGRAPLGYATACRNLYESTTNDGKLTDVHMKADVYVDTSYGGNTSQPQLHFLTARSNNQAQGGIVFGFSTQKGASKSSLVIGTYAGGDTVTPFAGGQTEAIYNIDTEYTLELFVVGSLVVAKCDGKTIFADTVSGIPTEGYCGLLDRRATSKSSGGTYGTDYVKGGYFDDFSISTITLDGFKVNGSVVADKSGNGVADISIMSGGVEVTDMDDVAVTVSEITAPTLRYIDLRDESAIALHGLCVDENSETFSRMDMDVALEIAGGTAFSTTSVYTHARESAGGRMRFSTNSSVIAIKAEFPSYVSNYATEMGAGKTGFDVYVDTESGSTYYGTISPTEAQLPTEDKTWSYEGQIEFDTEETRNITIYFPITNEVSEVSVGVEEDATVAANAIVYDDADPIVFYGSSITQGGVATKPGLTYVNTVGRMLGRDYIDLGVWGSAKGQTKFAEYIAGLDMSMFVFDYDHNAPNAQHLTDTHYAFYEIVRAAHPNIPIIFITRPNQNGDYEGHKQVIQGNYNKAVVAGDTNVYFIDGQTFFAGQTDCLADGVHPTDKGHSLMAANIGPVLANILGKTLPVQVADAGTESSNLSPSLNQGKYLITLKDALPVTTKTAKIDKVFVVNDLSKAVTSMTDTRWTGSTTTAKPRFTVDGSGKATLTPSGSTAAGLSVLNVGENNGSYTNYYAEYTLTVSGLTGTTTAEGNYRSDINNVVSVDSYGSTSAGKAWLATMFFDNRTTQVNVGKEFWARLTDLSSTHKNYSDSKSATDGIEIGTPVKVGMLVYDHTITLFFNDVEAATYTDETSAYTGWFGISHSNPTGTATVENFIYVPLTKEVVDVEFSCPKTVMQDGTVEVSAVPVYSWPYEKGESTTTGVTISGLDTSTPGEKNFKASYSNIEKELSITVTKKPDGFRVDGPVVATKDGKGVADITILAGDVEVESIEDAEVTVAGLTNPSVGLYEGSYEVTTSVYGTSRTATANRVFVVEKLSDAVTSMFDSRWTGEKATDNPNFTVDAITGKATLNNNNKYSVLSMGENDAPYSNFYVEYTLNISNLENTVKNWYSTRFIVTERAPAAIGRATSFSADVLHDGSGKYSARLYQRTENENLGETRKASSNTDVSKGDTMTIGMLVYDEAITYTVDGVVVATYTYAEGQTTFEGWFSLFNEKATSGNPVVTVDDFIYIPLAKELLDVEFTCSESVMQGGEVAVKAIPTYNWPYGTGEATTEGVTISGLDTSKTGEQTFKAYYNGIEKELKVMVVDKPDGFRVDGPVVATADGKSVADITILVGDADVEYIEDAEVTITGLTNSSVGLYEGSYSVSYDVYGTLRSASATRVFVVNNLDDAVTNMSDARWDGQTAIDTMPNFTVDETGGKATLSASSSASKALSILNVGKNAGKYSNFYVEYILTMSNIPEANNAFENYFCMDDTYTTYNKNSLNASIFFDTRSNTAVEKNFYARLRELDSEKNVAWSNNYSDKTEDVDIGDGIPMKIGMYVYDGTVTLLINGEEVITHTGKGNYEGRFGIWLGNTTATATVEDFIYVPLGEKKVEDIKFSYPQTVTPGASVKVSAIPVYNWPYGEGEAITEGVVVTGLDTSTLGEKTFKASYGGIEKALSLVVSKTMFEEDFGGTLSDLTDNGWENVSKTTVTLSDEKLYLIGNQEGLYATEVTGSDAWSDYTVKADVMMTSDGKSATTNVATLVARSTGLKDGYEWSLCVNKDGTSYVRLYDRAATKQLMKVDYPVDLNEVYTLKLTVVGNSIKGYVNGEKIIETTADTCLKGTVGLRRNGYGVYYDNLIVTLPEEDAPVPDVTKQQIWFTDTFEDESTMTERGWNMDGTIKNGKLVLTHKNPTAFLTQISGSSGWTDYTAKADITVVESDEISSVNNSVSALIVRSTSGSTGYEFGVSIMASDDKGGFRLYNRTTQETLASTKDVVAERGKTYQLTTVVEGNRILCFVDGKLVFDVTDTKNSNPSGYVGLRTVGYSGAYDNIIVRKVTDVDRKEIISDSNSDSPSATSPTTGDVAMPIYIPIIVMIASLAVVVFYIRRRFYTKQ